MRLVSDVLIRRKWNTFWVDACSLIEYARSYLISGCSQTSQ